MTRTKVITLLVLCYALAMAVRLTAPFDLHERDQGRQGLYVLDILHRGSFFLPYEFAGEDPHGDPRPFDKGGPKPTSKPPLFNWAAVLLCLAWGDVTDTAIRIPAAACGLGVFILTFLIGEKLFSRRAGFLAALVLLVTQHFLTLTAIARTDMMLCCFWTLALYLFLLAYERRDRKSAYPFLIYVALGFGTLTKGPVVLLALLTAVIFLLIRRDFRALRALRPGWGALIWAGITLAWFIPAWIEGGDSFFEIVIRDQMVDRFLGVGSHAMSGEPALTLLGVFFMESMPWCFVTVIGLSWFFARREARRDAHWLFAVVWFLTTMAFFSFSSGKRSDYLLPLYPAAAIVATQFWLSAADSQAPRAWRIAARVLAILCAGGSLLVGLGLLSAVAFRGPLQEFALRFGKPHEIVPFFDSLQLRRVVVLAASALLVCAAVAAFAAAERRKMVALFVLLICTAALQATLYLHALSPRAVSLRGPATKAFCLRARERLGPDADVIFVDTPREVLFYLQRNARPRTLREAKSLLRAPNPPYVIGRKETVIEAFEAAGVAFESLDRTGPLPKGPEYVLVRLRRGSD